LNTNYDYIIAGMGCAGLSLAVRLSEAGLTKGKKILLVDRAVKDRNDRTWCFWETKPGFFEDIVFRSWNKAWFNSNDLSALLDLAPYHYKMIRGIDFFQHCMSRISADVAFDIKYGEVKDIYTEEFMAYLVLNEEEFGAPILFNSIVEKNLRKKSSQHHLLQHFKGWVIKTKEPVFETHHPVLMDFRTPQTYGTSFVYVMPISTQEALVEYTLFTPSLLPSNEYDEGLKSYLHQFLGTTDWEIIEEEFGVIPMTNVPFKKINGRIRNIGTAGGMTKASSGYTFRFIQKDIEQIIETIKDGADVVKKSAEFTRFNWYDSVLLNVLALKKMQGADVFSCLFQKNKPEMLLKFLDNETKFAEELRIMTTLPQWLFMKAGLQEGFNLLR